MMDIDIKGDGRYSSSRRLPYKYSIMDLWRKNLIYTDPNWNWWKDDLSNLYNAGWIYQFNAIPPNKLNRDQAYWMERIHNELYT